MTKRPGFVENSPDRGQAYEGFSRACREKGVLDRKTKELLRTALACVLRCQHCPEEHMQRALEAGASKEEITEALLIAALEGAGMQLAWMRETHMKYLRPGAGRPLEGG
jgi:AhpD family alkylhydroperoxidase